MFVFNKNPFRVIPKQTHKCRNKHNIAVAQRSLHPHPPPSPTATTSSPGSGRSPAVFLRPSFSTSPSLHTPKSKSE
ncbi:hypothetical protein HanIR_Chr08g0375731 [Helianthus annuus]|nr:hypothetical protein HanIR_Chr08g0375731 [Helianthus annuus]